MVQRQQLILAVAVYAIAWLQIAPAYSADAPAATDRWALIKKSLFADREINESDSVIRLQAPRRAFDAARVPLTLQAQVPQSKDYFIKRLFVVVDKNPLPLAGTFNFKPNNGWATIDTEVRVNEYTNVRVVAETSDDKLHMSTRFIKAVGGCSAPPSSYDRSDSINFGKINFDLDELLNSGVPALARFRITHPNSSGMQFDQMTRTYIPAHYIHTIVAQFDGEEIFNLQTNFSLSQDPTVGFNFVPRKNGEMKIYAIDSKNERFEQAWSIKSEDQ